MKAVSPSVSLVSLRRPTLKGNEKKRNMYVSQINFCHDLQPAYDGLSFEYHYCACSDTGISFH